MIKNVKFHRNQSKSIYIKFRPKPLQPNLIRMSGLSTNSNAHNVPHIVEDDTKTFIHLHSLEFMMNGKACIEIESKNDKEQISYQNGESSYKVNSSIFDKKDIYVLIKNSNFGLSEGYCVKIANLYNLSKTQINNCNFIKNELNCIVIENMLDVNIFKCE